MKYKLAIFDMDGTILNTLDDITDSTNYTLRTYGMPEHPAEIIKSFLGNGTRHLIEKAVVDGTKESVLEDMIAFYSDYYRDHCKIKTGPYDGIPELLKRLKKAGIYLAVVSNKPDFAVKSLSDEMFYGLFDLSVGDKPGQRIKPYPDSVNAVIDHFRVPKNEVIYLGDSEVDYQTAENAGIDRIMVSWGFRSIGLLESLGAKYIVNTPEEAGNIILNG